jgi:hypothetical protein
LGGELLRDATTVRSSGSKFRRGREEAGGGRDKKVVFSSSP